MNREVKNSDVELAVLGVDVNCPEVGLLEYVVCRMCSIILDIIVTDILPRAMRGSQ